MKDIYSKVNNRKDIEIENIHKEVDKLKQRKTILFDKYLDKEIEEEAYKEKNIELENRIKEEFKKMPKETEINDEKLNKIEMYSELLVDLYRSQDILNLDEKVNILKNLDSELLITQEKELQLAESKLVKTLKKLQNHVWYPQQESNLHLPLRRGLFYPLNYEDKKIAYLR